MPPPPPPQHPPSRTNKIKKMDTPRQNRSATSYETETPTTSTSARPESSKSSLGNPTVVVTQFYASTLPVPQRPFQHRPISQADATEWSALCQETADRLTKWNFDYQSVDLLNVQHPGGIGLRPRLKIGVSSTNDHDNWKETILKLYKEIHKAADSSRLGLDIESPNPNSMFVVKPDHPFVTTWSGLRDKVVSSLRGYDWRAIDVLMYGKTREKAKPTVFVTMEERQSDEWLSLRQIIRGVVGDQADIEKREGNVQEFATRINDLNPTESQPHQAYAERVHGGWSIGVDDRSSGTLGGFVTLREKHGETKVYGLTNYHVVRPELTTFPASIDRGSKDVPWPPEFRSVYSSSNEDFEEEKQHLKRQLEDEARARKLYPPHLERKVKMGQDLTVQERQNLQYLNFSNERKGRLESRQAQLNNITDGDRRLGEVAYYAGFRVQDNFRLDWALVDVAKGRVGQNRLPSSEELPGGFYLTGDRIQEFGTSLDKEPPSGPYFKIGRTTGLTIGDFNAIKSETSLEVPRNDEDRGGAKRKVLSQAHVLVAQPGSGPLFSRGGDSGAWVCDRFGSLVGLIWGGGAETSYCTPIGPIIADIEAQTGMKVELP